MSNRDKVPAHNGLVVVAAVLCGKKKETFTSNERYFLTLAVKLKPVLSTADKRWSLCTPVGMALLCSCMARHPGVVEENTFALPWPRDIITILCSSYSHVPGCRWWRSPPLCWKKSGLPNLELSLVYSSLSAGHSTVVVLSNNLGPYLLNCFLFAYFYPLFFSPYPWKMRLTVLMIIIKL